MSHTRNFGTQIFITTHSARWSHFTIDIAFRELINDQFSSTCTGSSILSDKTELYFLISILISKVLQAIFRYNRETRVNVFSAHTCALVCQTPRQINI